MSDVFIPLEVYKAGNADMFIKLSHEALEVQSELKELRNKAQEAKEKLSKLTREMDSIYAYHTLTKEAREVEKTAKTLADTLEELSEVQLKKELISKKTKNLIEKSKYSF